MPTMVKINCEYCNKEYEKELKRFNEANKKGSKHYCSQECKNASARKGEYKPCGFCGKVVYRTQGELAKSKSGEVFCNRSCSTSYNNIHVKVGVNNPNYVNGIGAYRNNALRTYENVCAICRWNEDKRILEVHHIDETRTNSNIENLIILCPICHRKITLGYFILDAENKKLISND